MLTAEGFVLPKSGAGAGATHTVARLDAAAESAIGAEGVKNNETSPVGPRQLWFYFVEEHQRPHVAVRGEHRATIVEPGGKSGMGLSSTRS